LANALFKETPEEFTTRVAKNVKGARALIEAGFEKVDDFDGVHIYRKRKYTKLQRQPKCGESSIENYLKHLWRYPPQNSHFFVNIIRNNGFWGKPNACTRHLNKNSACIHA